MVEYGGVWRRRSHLVKLSTWGALEETMAEKAGTWVGRLEALLPRTSEGRVVAL